MLKELVRLYNLRRRKAEGALFKSLYRLALTHRDLLGTGLLLHLSAEWDRVEASRPRPSLAKSRLKSLGGMV